MNKRHRHKNFTYRLNKTFLSLVSMLPCVSNYILCIQHLIFKQKYIPGEYMLTPSDLFFELKYSTLVSNLYGLMRSILYLISITPYCKFTVPLVKHCVITNGTVYGVSYFYAVCLVSMKLSPTLLSWSTLCLFLRILSLLIWAWFRWRINSQSTSCFIGRIISWLNTNWPGLQPFNPLVVEKITNYAAAQMPIHGSC